MRFGTAPHNVGSGHPDDDVTLQVVHVETREDIFDLRDNHPEFHDGALSVLTYKSVAIGFLSHYPPKDWGGVRFLPGGYITKDDAGNFGVLLDEQAFVENGATQ